MSDALEKTISRYPYTKKLHSYRGAARIIAAGNGQTITVFKEINGVHAPIATGVATCEPALVLDVGIGASEDYTICVEGTNGDCLTLAVIDTNFTITPPVVIDSIDVGDIEMGDVTVTNDCTNPVGVELCDTNVTLDSQYIGRFCYSSDISGDGEAYGIRNATDGTIEYFDIIDGSVVDAQNIDQCIPNLNQSYIGRFCYEETQESVVLFDSQNIFPVSNYRADTVTFRITPSVDWDIDSFGLRIFDGSSSSPAATATITGTGLAGGSVTSAPLALPSSPSLVNFDFGPITLLAGETYTVTFAGVSASAEYNAVNTNPGTEVLVNTLATQAPWMLVNSLPAPAVQMDAYGMRDINTGVVQYFDAITNALISDNIVICDVDELPQDCEYIGRFCYGEASSQPEAVQLTTATQVSPTEVVYTDIDGNGTDLNVSITGNGDTLSITADGVQVDGFNGDTVTASVSQGTIGELQLINPSGSTVDVSGITPAASSIVLTDPGSGSTNGTDVIQFVGNGVGDEVIVTFDPEQTSISFFHGGSPGSQLNITQALLFGESAGGEQGNAYGVRNCTTGVVTYYDVLTNAEIAEPITACPDANNLVTAACYSDYAGTDDPIVSWGDDIDTNIAIFDNGDGTFGFAHAGATEAGEQALVDAYRASIDAGGFARIFSQNGAGTALDIIVSDYDTVNAGQDNLTVVESYGETFARGGVTFVECLQAVESFETTPVSDSCVRAGIARQNTLLEKILHDLALRALAESNIIDLPAGADIANGDTFTFPVSTVRSFTVSREGTGSVVVDMGANGSVTLNRNGSRTWDTGRLLRVDGVTITSNGAPNADVIWEFEQ